MAIYAGYYNGKHFITHTGNSRGPEISTIDAMTKGGNLMLVNLIIVPEFVEETGAIQVYKKDTNGKNLAGAYFTATNKAMTVPFSILLAPPLLPDMQLLKM